jgi:hypothetical protein
LNCSPRDLLGTLEEGLLVSRLMLDNKADSFIHKILIFPFLFFKEKKLSLIVIVFIDYSGASSYDAGLI